MSFGYEIIPGDEQRGDVHVSDLGRGRASVEIRGGRQDDDSLLVVHGVTTALEATRAANLQVESDDQGELTYVGYGSGNQAA